jgi:L-lactate utilization protein LutC
MQLTVIQQKIYEIRGHKVMLDFDLAELYQVETKRLNEQVKRNIERFPDDFMFRLAPEEWEPMRSQNATALQKSKQRRSQNATASQKKRNITATPYAFTEHGVSMLASVLKSDRAIKMNIAIVRVFIALRQFAINYKDLANQINEIKSTVTSHSEQLNQIYDAIENMLDEKEEKKEEKRRWKEREPIGFKNNKK